MICFKKESLTRFFRSNEAGAPWLILHQNITPIIHFKYSNDNNNFTENNQFGFVYFGAVLIA